MSLPKFSQVNPITFPSQLKQLLNSHQHQIEQLLQQKTYTWNNLMGPIEELDDQLHHLWSPISHLHSVSDHSTLREAYKKGVVLLTQYHNQRSHNQHLFRAIQSLANSQQYSTLNRAQRKVIENALRDFRLAGVGLSARDQVLYDEWVEELSKLSIQFANNLLDATQHWQFHTQDSTELAGLPEPALALAHQAAQAKGLTGWLFSLEAPSYLAVMTYADQRNLRKKFYQAYITRASDKGANPQWDNSLIMQEIMTLRGQLARLLGFRHYAEYSLATKMADTPEQVLNFLYELKAIAYPKAKQELATLSEFAKQCSGVQCLAPWDILYFSEKLLKQNHAISDEILRSYFPLDQVLKGLFELTFRLYGISIQLITGVDTWHPDVQVFALYDSRHQLLAKFYVDLYAREGKREGAWMDECQMRRQLKDNSIQIPVAYLTCNFRPPLDGKPALLTHHDVLTLFHEFGHSLQHMLTQVDYPEVCGIRGVPWDAVELPSQLMECFAFQKEVLALISRHYQTEETLPDDLLEKIQQARNFQSAMQLVRQLEFALFDFRLHMEFDAKEPHHLQTILDQVRQAVCVTPIDENNRFQHGFSHIFSGGYAAGYYGYLWAEVMAADAFSLFIDNGLWDKTTASHFRQCILEAGGSEEALVLFERFRKHKPQVDAFLKQKGMMTA